MSTTIDFNTLKRKVYLAYHQDGILDLTAAMVLLGFGTSMAIKSDVFLILGVILAAQYVLMKQHITIPRFGYVRFVPQEKTLMQLWFLIGLGVLVLSVVLVLDILLSNRPNSPEMQTWIQQYHMVPLSAVLFGLPALVAAVFLGLKRFYLYAVLTVGLSALGAWLNIETFIPILATGLVVLAFGIGLLSSFLKQHPVDDKAGGNVGG
jgi:uncharacterized sodium:solute symporter family permease YidK